MRTEQLRYIILLERYHSTVKVGEILDIAYQTVDFGLKGLEQELGVPLVKRRQAGLYLTEYGELVKLFAQDILAKYDDLKRPGVCGEHPPFKFSVVTSAVPNYVFLQDVCTAAELQRENIEISIFRKSNQEIREAVHRRKALLGFMTVHDLQAIDGGLAMEVLFEDQSFAAMSQKHPLAKMKRLTKEMLRGYPVSVYWEEDDALAGHIGELEQQAAMSFRTNDAKAFEQSLLGDLNVGFITRALAECSNFWANKDQLVFRPLQVALHPIIVAIYRRDEDAEKMAVINTFLSSIKSYLS